MLIHQNTKFGNKLCGGLEDIIWTNINILTLRYDLDLNCSNSIFPQDTLAYDAKLSNQVWLQTEQQFRRYGKKCDAIQKTSSQKTFTEILNLLCDLDLEYSNPIFSTEHSGL